MSKRYQLLESWHNGCDNAENELYAVCNNENDAKEILFALRAKFEIYGLGDGFPPVEDYRLMSEVNDNIYSFWLIDHVAKEGWNGPMSSEYRRIFRIVIEDPDHPKWDFMYEEEIHEEFRDYMQGVITDGIRMLFYRTYNTSNKYRICKVYASINEMVNDGQEEVSYHWNAENDAILIDALNNLQDPNSYCGEGSPIRTLKFRKRDRATKISHIIRKIDKFLHETKDDEVVYKIGDYE